MQQEKLTGNIQYTINNFLCKKNFKLGNTFYFKLLPPIENEEVNRIKTPGCLICSALKTISRACNSKILTFDLR